MFKKSILPIIIVVYAVFALAFVGNLNFSKPEPVKAGPLPQPVSTGNVLVDEINKIRFANSLPSVTLDQSLSNIASDRTEDMTKNNYYAHKGSDGAYFNDLMNKAGIKYDFACENLDLSFSGDNASQYIEDWMNSTKGHRECLLNDKVKKVGVSVANMPVNGAADASIAAAIFSTN